MLAFPYNRVYIEGDTQFTDGWAHEIFRWRIEGDFRILENYEIRLAPGVPAVLPGWR